MQFHTPSAFPERILRAPSRLEGQILARKSLLAQKKASSLIIMMI
jgi:hypothetical protein